MNELLELHILQNFAPSNLNRDDTGSPKDCMFGGSRRARISTRGTLQQASNAASVAIKGAAPEAA